MSPVVVRNLEAALLPLGSHIAAHFCDCGLVEDLPELHGQTIAGMDFNRAGSQGANRHAERSVGDGD